MEPSELALLKVGMEQMSERPPSQNPALVYLAHQAGRGRSIRTVRDGLNIVAKIITNGQCDAEALPWGQLRYQHTAAIRAALMEHYAPRSTNKYLSHLRGVLKVAWLLDQMSAEDYHRAAQVKSIKNDTLPKGRAISEGELRALFAECWNDDTPAGRRDTALLAVLRGAGLRRSELVSLDLADYDLETGSLMIRQGKGNKDRMVYATNGSKTALDDWLDIRGSEAGPLFLPVRKGGTIEQRRMSDQTVADALQRRAEKAGLKEVTPHDFRRTFISDLLDAGADISTVQKLAGHANVTTTARYDRRGEVTKRKAAELLHVPIPARKKNASTGQKLVEA
jgi:site-specific recombinase XerD